MDNQQRQKTGRQLIEDERSRQINVEGFDARNDDAYGSNELEKAAKCYHRHASDQVNGLRPTLAVPSDWPWHAGAWKPSDDPVRNFVKGGALYMAQGDKLAREAERDAGAEFRVKNERKRLEGLIHNCAEMIRIHNFHASRTL